MLTEEEKREIDAEAPTYPRRDALCIDALKTVQRHRGWVSDEAIADVARYLGMSAATVEGVASFYNLIYRRPVGKHVIHVCDSVSCWIMGYESLYSILKRKFGVGFGETTPDKLFTLLPIQCLGHCEKAPALMIDGVTYSGFTEVQLTELLAALQRGDQ